MDRVNVLSREAELETLLSSAYAGLQWYRATYPDAESEADDEFYTVIEATLGGKKTPLTEVLAERKLQDAEWGGSVHDDKHDWFEWRQFLYRQITAMSMESDDARRRKRFIKIAALAFAAIESMDRKCQTKSTQ